MDDFSDSLDRIKLDCSEIIEKFEASEITNSIEALEKTSNEVGKSWCGSWLGYHSRIYYQQLAPAPPGSRFSQEWGFQDRFSNDTVGDWCEYSFDEVYDFLKSSKTAISFDELEEISDLARKRIPDIREELISIIESFLSSKEDAYLTRLKNDTEKCVAFTKQQFIEYLRPRGQFMSRDMVALQAGIQTPPHIYFQAQLLTIKAPAQAASSLKNIINRLALHLSNKSRTQMQSSQLGTHVFIGHGRSPLWRELKDFVSERLELPWDEFNRVPIAGLSNTTRLLQMLDSAAIAFLVMTAEDEQNDGRLQARMNVIHEAGLFQGRLGFTRAIVLLEEGCEEFSNIQGLGQIRFPRGNIKACFEDVRMVLERESLA